MSSGGVAAYGRVLRHGAALRPFLASVLARLPFAMAPLGMILLVQEVRGAYGIAGAVTGCYALGTAAGAPVWGRSMDRFGQPRVILPTTVASAALLAALAVATVLGARDPVLLVLAAASGATFPPVGPGMRAAWRVVFSDPVSRRAGYALDAVSVESIFVGGPLLLSLLLVTTPPVVPLLVTAALLLGGGVGYSRTAAARSYEPVREAGLDDEAEDVAGGPVGAPGSRTAATAPGVLGVLLVILLMSVGFGQLDTSIAATAREVLGGQAQLGVLFAAIAGGSVTGGLWYGARHWAGQEHRRLPLALGTFALALVPVPVLLLGGRPSLWLLLPLLYVAGLSIAPSLIMLQNMLDGLAPPHRVNEAQSLLTAATTTGAAAGTAIAGILIDLGGPARSFVGAVLAVAVSCAIAVLGQRRWRVVSPPPTLTGVSGG